MTLSEPIPHLRDFFTDDLFEIPRSDAQFFISSSVGENQNPDVVFRSQQVHGLSYVHSGYFTQEGIRSDGRLYDELDGTRSTPNNEIIASYLLATRRGMEISEGSATVRLLDIGPEGSLENLPTYKYFSNSFSQETRDQLDSIIATYGKGSIREIAALGTSDRYSHPGSFELIRAMMQNSMLKEVVYGKPELYIASLTPKSLGPVLKFIDQKSAKLLGEPVQIFSDDPRSLSIYVTPLLIDLSSVLRNTLIALDGTDDLEEKKELTAKYQFLVDGLPPSVIAHFTDTSVERIL